jgi:hypothetical protein
VAARALLLPWPRCFWASGWWILTQPRGQGAAHRVGHAASEVADVGQRGSSARLIPAPHHRERGMRALKAGEYQILKVPIRWLILGLIEGGQVLSTTSSFLRTVEVPADTVEGYLFPICTNSSACCPDPGGMVARLRERISPGRRGARARSEPHQYHLASIIEKEALERREMPLISAIFWNRLKLRCRSGRPHRAVRRGKDRQRLTTAPDRRSIPIVARACLPAYRQPSPPAIRPRQAPLRQLSLLRRHGRRAASPLLEHARGPQRRRRPVSARPQPLSRGTIRTPLGSDAAQTQ